MAEVRAVYDTLADRPLQRDCQGRAACCHFRQTGKTPQLTRGEALVLAQGVRAAGRTAESNRSNARSSGTYVVIGNPASD